MKIINKFILLCVSCFALNACTSSEYIISLKDPTVLDNGNVVEEKLVYIADVTDNRLFVNSSADPSVPNGKNLTRDYKARAFATFTPLVADEKSGLLLPKSTSVCELVKAILIQAYKDAGYAVVTDLSAENDESNVIVVAASIKNFWAYSQMKKVSGFIYANITTDVYMQHQNRQKHLYLSTVQSREVITDTKDLYKKTFDQAIENFEKAAVEKIKLSRM